MQLDQPDLAFHHVEALKVILASVQVLALHAVTFPSLMECWTLAMHVFPTCFMFNIIGTSKVRRKCIIPSSDIYVSMWLLAGKSGQKP